MREIIDDDDRPVRLCEGGEDRGGERGDSSWYCRERERVGMLANCVEDRGERGFLVNIEGGFRC